MPEKLIDDLWEYEKVKAYKKMTSYFKRVVFLIILPGF
jgi:hypothetical protein